MVEEDIDEEEDIAAIARVNDLIPSTPTLFPVRRKVLKW